MNPSPLPLSPQLPRPVKILVVDDHPLTRMGMVQMIAAVPDFAIYGEAASASGVILAIDDDPPPDAILLDLMLGREDGLELIKQIRCLRPGLPVLVVSAYDEWVYAKRALRAGASGYLMKNAPPEEVQRAIRAIMGGEIYLSARMSIWLAARGLAPDVRQSLVPEAEPPLSDRELHVYQLLGIGLGSRQIASAMRLGLKTVETYRENLKAKLRLPNAVALVKSAKEWVETIR